MDEQDGIAPIRLSVVVPAFNEAGYLAATLDSLSRQDFAGSWEILVVDNDSSDATASIARAHGARVLVETRPGVCAARQLGTEHAHGQILVSTDADTVHPRDWLTRIDAAFRADPSAVAVAGPCRYGEPLWWAVVFPRLWFDAVGVVYTVVGKVFYVTATNMAFLASSFPGYDTTLTQGGDEYDILRRLRGRGRVVWDRHNAVVTSSRRMDQGLAYTLFVSFGYYYAFAYVRNRLSSGRVRGIAPAIRREHAALVRRRRRRWLGGLALAASASTALAWRRRATTTRHH
jgi:glycosyltransferase involved in cell wall biosynthesis